MQYVASLEKTVSPGTTVGLRATHARTLLSYAGATTTDADANVSQLFGMVRIANGQGLHSVLELSAGATVYSQFRARPDGAALSPSKPDADFAFAIVCFGYAFSPAFPWTSYRDVTTSLHQKTGLSASDKISSKCAAPWHTAGRALGLGGP